MKSRGKITSSVQNAKVFMDIQHEFGTFDKHIWSFTNRQTIRDVSLIWESSTPISEEIAKDLKKRGMKYMGATTTYAYLQAVGIYNNHEPSCFIAPEHNSPKPS